MTQEDELEQLRAEMTAWREIAHEKHREVQQLQQEKQVLREGLKEAIQAIERFQEHAKNLEGQIDVLQERVKILEGQQAKDSHNSNLPPSSDRFVRPPKSLRQKSGKKPGGQPGHRGHHLKQVETPDTVLIHPVAQCEHCQRDLRDRPATLPERRQVIDLPVKRLWVTEHRVEEKQCPTCFHLTRASFPATIKAPTQYGTGIAALAVSLVQGQAVPYARTSQLLHDLLGVQLSAGSIASFVKTCHHRLAGIENDLKAALMKAPVLHQDETGLRVSKEGWWVHVCSTDRLTHYAAHHNRGRVAMDAIGIAPLFRGTSVHDGLKSYQGYTFTQALCNVHHLRELTFLEEVHKQAWAKKMKDLLLDMKAEVEQARAAGKHQLDVPLLARLLRRYEKILVEGYQANPPAPPPKKPVPGKPKQSPARNLLDRFSQKKQAVLRFLYDFAVPFDNNQAERDLRMIKVQQKVSGCFRTAQGITMFCRIRSYLSTLRKQEIALLSALEQALSGHPVLPTF
jgi:transposase